MKIPKFELTKRERIIIASGVLSLGLLSTQLVPFYLANRFIAGLTILAYLLSLWALWEGIDKRKAVILMILPTFFALAVSSYYFLLPVRWLTRLPVAVLFGTTFYTLLLSQNVFNVASTRTIPLYRVASTMVFILTLITSFLFFNVVFSLNLFFIWNGLIVFLLTFPLILQVLWTVEMEHVSGLILVYALSLSLVIAEIAIALSFWPLSKAMAALILSTAIYITLGIGTDATKDRLSRGVVWEYLGWGGVVFLVALMTTSWTG